MAPPLRAVALVVALLSTAAAVFPAVTISAEDAPLAGAPGMLDFGTYLDEEFDRTFFEPEGVDDVDGAIEESDVLSAQGKKMRGKKIDLDDADYDTDICGARFGKVRARTSAPNGIDKRQIGLANDFMRQAKRYGKDARAILVGDSIMEDLGDERKCLRTVFRRFRNKGFNWGISGIDVDFTKTLVNWLFSNNYPRLEPQVVFIAVGVNNCARGHGYNRVARGIVDIAKLVKYYSPQTRVVVQGVLPSGHGTRSFEGKKFSDMKLYDCIRKANTVVERWIKRNDERCIEFEDLSGAVLSGGKFRKDVLRDGLHFDKDGMDDYCEDIAEAIKSHSGVRIKSSDANVFSNWTDVEPLHVPDVEGNETLYRWRYNAWSNCTGACGVQRRTAECHAVTMATGESHIVAESLCIDTFMNPVERVCNLEPACQAELGPLGALLRQPIPASTRSRSSSIHELVGEENKACGSSTKSINNAVYIAVVAALAAALLSALIALFLVKRSIAQQQGDEPSEQTATEDGRNEKQAVTTAMEKPESSNISAIKV